MKYIPLMITALFVGLFLGRVIVHLVKQSERRDRQRMNRIIRTAVRRNPRLLTRPA